jgi:hypothetical protein
MDNRLKKRMTVHCHGSIMIRISHHEMTLLGLYTDYSSAFLMHTTLISHRGNLAAGDSPTARVFENPTLEQ